MRKGCPEQRVLPWLGAGICLYLLYSASILDKIARTIVILGGIPLYIYFSPKTDIHDLKKLFTSEEAIFTSNIQKKNRFLATSSVTLDLYNGKSFGNRPRSF